MTHLPTEPRRLSPRTRSRSWLALLAALALGCGPAPTTREPAATPSIPSAPAQPAATIEPPRPLSKTETAIAAYIDQHNDEAIALLERVVNINSGTLNPDGVRKVADVFAEEFRALAFETRWIPMDAVHRAGHLFAERKGTVGKRLLLIGHLDTVFEKDSPFQRFERLSPTVARGPGTSDMKGGDVAILYALKALAAAGALDRASIVVALTGDEENPGDPLDVTRKDLIDAAKRSDAALEFEQGVGGPNSATIARRGFTSWTLQVHGKPGHSSGIFTKDSGAGAIYEAARILDGFYSQIRGEQYLTFNPSVIVGGNQVDYNHERESGTASGKSNIIPQAATVTGDLRTLTPEQLARTKTRMLAIVQQSLPQTSAELTFRDEYPPMAPTEGNQALLRELQGVSRDLGLGPVDVIDPGKRGAADISFVAPFVASLSGLGPAGDGAHAPGETVDLASMPVVTRRVALLMHRLTRE
jgi:glutamate carboxypeptidase